MITAIAAGFMIGVLGSFHCVGMCGPIALSLPVYDQSRSKKFALILLYNFGRVLAYASLGLLFGFLGKQFFIGGYQRFLSIAAGVLILTFLFFSRYLDGNKFFIRQFTASIKNALGKLLRSEKKFYTYIFIGFLNGLLPCGLVYVAVAAAVATGDPLNSSLLMAGFGFGTFPVMVSVMVFGKFIPMQWRNHMRRAMPVFIGLMGLLLILRGMNLGIPYVSPELTQTANGVHSCCQK